MSGKPAIVRPFQSLVRHSLAAATLLYVLGGLVAMLWLSPKVPYADGWRLVGNLAAGSFPGNVLHADNGHREVLPNLVRLIELHALDANQWLQVGVGIALVLATFLLLLRAIDSTTAPEPQRKAAVCAIAMGLFWLGSQRTLAHGNETVHAYLITACLAAGLMLMQRGDARSMLAAIALGAIATFTFGSGIACFAAFAAVLWLQRGTLRAWLMLCAGSAFVALLYIAGNAGSDSLQFAPWIQLSLLLRWLSAPFAYAFWPAIDTDVASQVPTVLGPGVLLPIARAWESTFGPFETSTWPWLGIGLAGIALLAFLALRARRKTQVPAMAVTGLALSAFALAVGGVIAAARAHYFADLHPHQLLATRYVVWSSLFWVGLLLAAIGLSSKPLRMAVFTLAVAILLAPSQLWMAQLALRMRAVAEYGATMAANGVVDPGVPMGETVPGELAAAMPVLRREHASVYVWPEVERLGARLDATASRSLAASEWGIEAVTGSHAPAATSRVTFRAESDAERLLILDDRSVARGVARRDPQRSGSWIGWVSGPVAVEQLHAAELIVP